ncbi:MAG: Do family serine endopeptidase [Planctomycetes bacterium]|nr:Do family serine endopeptidase [Planctomycetota bacterium]
MKKTARTLIPWLLALSLAAAWFSPCRAGTVRLTREEEAALASVNTISRAFTGVAKIIRPAVVNIKVERRVTVRGFNNPFEFFFGQRGMFPGMPRTETQMGQGSGVIVDSKGYILTNNHVVGDADAIRVFLLDGRQFQAELIGADPSSDVAVIQINADNLSVATVGDSDAIEVGEWVLAVCNPFGLDFTVTSGIISAKGRSGLNMLDLEDFIQTDASINPGNSGGPLVNLKGEVIGINTMILTGDGGGQTNIGVGFAIPSNMARSIMQSLISHKRVTAAYLGVESQGLSPDMAQAFGLQAPKGALIQAVHRNSPAEKAGFRRGDVVVRWGRREIPDDQMFRNLVTLTTPGQPVDVEVIRDGRTVLLSVILDANTPDMVIDGRGDRFLQNLGISVTDLTPELVEEIGYEPTAEGVLVYEVDRNSPAFNMGFRRGSIIISINGEEIRSVQDLKNAVGASERLNTYDIVWRNGQRVLRVTLRRN